MVRHLWVFVLAATVAVNVAFAQTDGLTIPELVRRKAPDPLYQSRIRELMPPAIEEVVSKVDLIVLGRVESSSTYLSKDQKSLSTDYVIMPHRVILQTRLGSSRVPGVAPPIIVRRWGGRTTIDGVQVTAEDADLRSFESGEDVLLFLVDANDGKYELFGLAAFSVSDNAIRPLVNHPNHQQFQGLTSAQFESLIRQLRK